MARAGCLQSRADLGEMTRAIDPELQETPPHLRPIGTTDGNFFAMEHGKVGGHDVVLVFVQLDVRWGLTEYHVVPFTMDDNKLIAGDRVQSGRDAMGGELYYGQAKAGSNGAIIIERKSVGEPLPPITFRTDAKGVMHANVPDRDPPPPPVADADRDGHDRRHALRVCGPKGAQTRLSKLCGAPAVTREGSVGPGSDDHILDRYKVACGRSVTKLFVDIYHCP